MQNKMSVGELIRDKYGAAAIRVTHADLITAFYDFIMKLTFWPQIECVFTTSLSMIFWGSVRYDILFQLLIKKNIDVTLICF